MSSDSFFRQYDLGAQLGRGGFSMVFKCTEISSGENRCVKIIERKHKKYSRKEFSILKQLSHPSIVKAYELIEEDDGTCYLIMERCTGMTLHKYLKIHRNLPDSSATLIAKELFEVIDYIHSTGFAHLDIKPANIIINPKTLGIKLIDFGFAVKEEAKYQTFCGSLPYAAPEIILHLPYSPQKADIWAAGLIYYELFKGELPWSESSLDSVDKLLKEICGKKIYSSEMSTNSSKLIVSLALERDPSIRATAPQILKLIESYQPKCFRIPVLPKLVSSSLIMRPTLRPTHKISLKSNC